VVETLDNTSSRAVEEVAKGAAETGVGVLDVDFTVVNGAGQADVSCWVKKVRRQTLVAGSVEVDDGAVLVR
jgi:hypothetical protein